LKELRGGIDIGGYFFTFFENRYNNRDVHVSLFQL
jgi:hypothetical protein